MIELISPGVLASIQDTGRYGYQALGIGPGGAMDAWAARVANVVLGNADDAPVLELTLGGAELRILQGAWFALTGADQDAVCDGEELALCAPVWIEAGCVLRLRRPLRGCRAYLAVAGGFVAERAFGSAATDARAGFGGHHGRALARGDRIAFAAGETLHPVHTRWWHTSFAWPALAVEAPLALVPGPALEQLERADREALLHAAFTLSPDSDRMGLRLLEALPSAARLPQQLSQAVAFGTVQLPPDGRPILLGADRQTTGGYPVAGVVAGVDHWRIAQARPGDRLRFRVTTADAAQRAWCAREQALVRLRGAASAWWKEA